MKSRPRWFPPAGFILIASVLIASGVTYSADDKAVVALEEGTTDPQGATTDPVTTTDPATTTDTVTTTDPVSTSGQTSSSAPTTSMFIPPPTSTTQPATSTTQPPTSTTQSATSTTQSATSTTQPVTSTTQPATSTTATTQPGGGGTTKIDGKVTMDADGSGVFSGRVLTETGAERRSFSAKPISQTCKDGRLIKLKKKRPGPNKTLGRDQTNRMGEWKIISDVEEGTLYAKLVRKTFHRHGKLVVCRGDRSASVPYRINNL